MAAPTYNTELFDSMVRHQIYLLRVSGSVRNKIFKLLNSSEDDIARLIRDRLRNTTGLSTSTDVGKLNTLLRFVQSSRLKSWNDVTAEWVGQMQDLATYEAGFFKQLVQTPAPVHFDMVTPSNGLLKALVGKTPFEGRTLRDWASTIADQDLSRISSQVRAGMVAGESSSVIARRVVGTAKLSGMDGVTEITRRNAEAITRTAVNFYAGEVRRQMMADNSDIISEEQFVATLDARTTAVCRGNDGKRFPIGRGPQPPLHYNCRSLRVPVIDDVAMADRPAKPVTERQLVKEYADDNDLGDISKRDDLPFGHKGSFDDFSAARVRELTGTVPADLSYNDWLSRQSNDFQDDILGKTKARLFRDGGLTLDKYVNRNGDELTLHELASKYASAFKKAGLDPTDF